VRVWGVVVAGDWWVDLNMAGAHSPRHTNVFGLAGIVFTSNRAVVRTRCS
jgi:hypothetical protein